MEVDDLLIDLAASMADVIGLRAGFVQGDAIRPQMLKEKRCGYQRLACRLLS